MLVHPQFDPIAFSIGPVKVHWYGISYLVGFAAFVMLGRLQAARAHWRSRGWSARDVEDLLFYGVVGVIVGGRLGYVLFYKPGYYAANPIEVFKVWSGGMSFHGGLIAVLLAVAWFALRRGRTFLEVGDFMAPCVPLGLASVRLGGNFVNGELWGRVADPSLPWAMVFPQAGLPPLPRHPSQIYQALLEGVTLFVVLWIVSRRARPLGFVSGVFLAGYGALRFVAEFFREPDGFLGLLALGLSMGQWLCLPMIAAGAWLITTARGRESRRTPVPVAAPGR
jgi:phosphatidylglycerol:prolipoprotein diacylglycerol transferase